MGLTAWHPNTWVESAQETNATATATKAAAAGSTHYITAVTASFTGGSDTGDLTIKDGATTLMTVSVHGDYTLALPFPIKATSGNAVSVEIEAGGASVVGNAAISGFTVVD